MDAAEKIKNFSLTQRDVFGKKSAKELRNQGNIPVNLYAQNLDKNIHGIIGAKILEKAYSQGCFFSRLFEIEDKTRNTKYLAFAQDVATHPVKMNILHIDFLVVNSDDVITRKVPIRVVDHELSPSIKLGGRVNFINRFVPINAKACQLPEIIELSVSNVKSGMMLRACDIKQNDDYSVVDPDYRILSLIGKKGKKATTETEGSA